jgi:uncharacterized protein (DUF58 family)
LGQAVERHGWAAGAWWLLWHLLLPPEMERTRPTRAGAVLIAVAFGIGLAAYNNANNVLFMALSLLLSSLVLSGLLSWVNFRGVRWRLRLPAHWRAGEPGLARLELTNTKEITPTYSLLFHARARRLGAVPPLPLPDRLDAGRETALEWIFSPRERGKELVEVGGAESQFPFGFMRKMAGGNLRQEVWVWPARVAYEFSPPVSRQPRQAGDTQRRPGPGADLLGLRPYRQGDAPRLVHWKASARLRQLVVRQTGEEQKSGYHLVVEPTRALWADAAQFERLCSFAASLAEDLFTTGLLRAATVQGGASQNMTRLTDLHSFFDQLAHLAPAEHAPGSAPASHDVITFQPGSRQQVHVYLGGQLAGSA